MGKKIIPHSLQEALIALRDFDCSIVAGGSDIMLQKRNTAGLLPKFEKDVLFVSNLKELHYEKEDKDGVHIGATMTLEEIKDHPLTPKVLKECISELASVNIRHFATLPGNIANASPAGDSIVVEICLNALLKIESIGNVRYEKVEDFVKGVRRIDLNKGEMITEVVFPKEDLTNTVWFKVGSRKAESISKVSFAAAYKLEKDVIKDIRLAFGSVFMKAIRSHEVENKLIGMSLKELKPQIEEIVQEYSKVISPIDDQRSTKLYRAQVAENIVRDFLTKLVEGGF